MGAQCLALVLASGALLGCRFHVGGQNSLEEENQRLRTELDANQQALEALEYQFAASAEDAELFENGWQISECLPLCASIEHMVGSGWYDADKDGHAEGVVLYLATLDQSLRFVPTSAQVTLQLIRTDTEEVYATEFVDADTFFNSYAVTFSGARYRLWLEHPADIDPVQPPLSLVIDLFDLNTERTHTHKLELNGTSYLTH